MSLQVRPISREEHLAFISARPTVSFLQCPAWGAVKKEWRSESIGWCDADGKIVGAGLVLYRQIPKVKRFLAYLPEGPSLDWSAVTSSADLSSVMDPMLAHLRRRKAFGVRMGPMVVTRRWSAETIKAAVAGGAATRLGDLTPDVVDAEAMRIAEMLTSSGWSPPSAGAGFTAGQPQYVFQVPLAGRTLDEVSAGFNQLWRRNIKKAEKSGVTVELGTSADLAEFHQLYLVTATRDHFTPRPLDYFTTMMDALGGEDPDRFRLYLARHSGELLAATIWIRVGTHAWYSYGASADHKRELRPSNAIQWRMLSDAHTAGATVYDLRGITDTLDPNDHLFGLIQFKLGTGGQAVEYLGEWDYPLNPLLHKAFQLYLARRG
ncbi:MAG TPA: peptidoglycan bridge formation glycyltransferase FemA/FemB family protein [Sporichthyaceae bacterium]|nr:peptidoglycan bridge formation glycyltransferase FemA/FemB family protein [Sporichthyaceae bacterium]